MDKCKDGSTYTTYHCFRLLSSLLNTSKIRIYRAKLCLIDNDDLVIFYTINPIMKRTLK